MIDLNLDEGFSVNTETYNLNFNINKYKYITEYAVVGGVDGKYTVEISNDMIGDNFLNYQYIDKELVYNPIPYDSKPIGAKLVYNGSKWIDIATPQEKQDFWKKRLIETNNQIKELQEIGLGGGSEESSLRANLEEYRTQYMNAVQEEAIEIDKGMV